VGSKLRCNARAGPLEAGSGRRLRDERASMIIYTIILRNSYDGSDVLDLGGPHTGPSRSYSGRIGCVHITLKRCRYPLYREKQDSILCKPQVWYSPRDASSRLTFRGRALIQTKCLNAVQSQHHTLSSINILQLPLTGELMEYSGTHGPKSSRSPSASASASSWRYAWGSPALGSGPLWLTAYICCCAIDGYW
jgi:hypothetical protein